VNERRLRILGALAIAGACLSVCVTASRAQLRPASGKVAGVVNDTLGVPQMGATVQLVSESAGALSAVDFLTNTQGVFRGEKVTPGLYTVRVTLAGFLPTLEQHVRINAHVTTVVRVELESMFASLDQLRRAPSSATVESEDWKWVLRSASATRPVLQWMDDDSSEIASNANLDKQVLRPRAHRPGDHGPGLLDHPPAAATLGMDGRGIAKQIPRISHRLPGFTAKRRGRIPVEIDAVRHEYQNTPKSRFLRSPRSLSAARDAMANGDSSATCHRKANALNALRDVEEACFLPLAPC